MESSRNIHCYSYCIEEIFPLTDLELTIHGMLSTKLKNLLQIMEYIVQKLELGEGGRVLDAVIVSSPNFLFPLIYTKKDTVMTKTSISVTTASRILNSIM